MSEKGKQEWFAEWFDTSYYHILYKNRDFKEAERFISNLLKYLDLPKDSNCLDLACGKGRHSVFLNEKGFKVTGVDLSPESIQAAKVFENERLNFDVHDMREVYKSNAYDVIFNLFTSFGYFESDQENERVLNAIHSMLKPDGVVVIDFMNAHKAIKNLVSNETKKVDDIVFNINRSFDGAHIIKNIQFTDDGNDFNFQERVQGINKDKFIQLFKQTGFEIIDIYGNFSLDAFDLENSDRLIFICKKK
jgi:2-polyprenyl-3-methyl-5-hydroxy-6-metoxy-1,4-benzoquinol methylase